MKIPAVLDSETRDIIERLGYAYKPALCPDDIQRGPVGTCFDTCLLAALKSNGKYQYVEGMATYDGKAYLHAWLTDGEYAFDPTWAAEYKGLSVPPPIAYMGLPLLAEDVAMFVALTDHQGVLANRNLAPHTVARMFEESLGARV